MIAFVVYSLIAVAIILWAIALVAAIVLIVKEHHRKRRATRGARHLISTRKVRSR